MQGLPICKMACPREGVARGVLSKGEVQWKCLTEKHKVEQIYSIS